MLFFFFFFFFLMLILFIWKHERSEKKIVLRWTLTSLLFILWIQILCFYYSIEILKTYCSTNMSLDSVLPQCLCLLGLTFISMLLQYWFFFNTVLSRTFWIAVIALCCICRMHCYLNDLVWNRLKTIFLFPSHHCIQKACYKTNECELLETETKITL